MSDTLLLDYSAATNLALALLDASETLNQESVLLQPQIDSANFLLRSPQPEVVVTLAALQADSQTAGDEILDRVYTAALDGDREAAMAVLGLYGQLDPSRLPSIDPADWQSDWKDAVFNAEIGNHDDVLALATIFYLAYPTMSDEELDAFFDLDPDYIALVFGQGPLPDDPRAGEWLESTGAAAYGGFYTSPIDYELLGLLVHSPLVEIEGLEELDEETIAEAIGLILLGDHIVDGEHLVQIIVDNDYGSTDVALFDQFVKHYFEQNPHALLGLGLADETEGTEFYLTVERMIENNTQEENEQLLFNFAAEQATINADPNDAFAAVGEMSAIIDHLAIGNSYSPDWLALGGLAVEALVTKQVSTAASPYVGIAVPALVEIFGGVDTDPGVDAVVEVQLGDRPAGALFVTTVLISTDEQFAEDLEGDLQEVAKENPGLSDAEVLQLWVNDLGKTEAPDPDAPAGEAKQVPSPAEQKVLDAYEAMNSAENDMITDMEQAGS